MQLESLIESIRNVINLKETNFDETQYSSKDLLIDLLNIYATYLENIDSEEQVPNNHEGKLSYDLIHSTIGENVKKIIKDNTDKSNFGGVTLFPEDDLVDLIISLESSIYVHDNVNKTAFFEEFLFQVRHVSHQYLVNVIIYLSQLNEIHT